MNPFVPSLSSKCPPRSGMLLSISDNLELWPPASLFLLPWWRLGHLPVTAERLNSFGMCSRGSPVCAASGHNSAARARGARLLLAFPGHWEGVLALDFRFHPKCSWALLTESLSDLHCRFCPSHLPQAGGHELCDFSGYPERRLLAKSCPRASRSWPLWHGVHRTLATGSCLPISSVSETPAQAVVCWGLFVPAPKSWLWPIFQTLHSDLSRG